jgi:hypothetical protein
MPASLATASLQYLSLTSAPSIGYASGSVLTVAAFIKPSDLTRSYDILAKNQNAYANGAYCLRYNAVTNKIDWIVNTYIGSYVVSTPVPPSLTTASSGSLVVAYWYPTGAGVGMNAGAFTSGTTVASINPEARLFQGTAHDSVALESYTFTIGYDPGNSNATYMNGKIGYVGVWNRLLLASEITTMYNSGGGTNFAALASAMKANLAGWWDLTANANDSSQFGLNLTNNATATFGFTW